MVERNMKHVRTQCRACRYPPSATFHAMWIHLKLAGASLAKPRIDMSLRKHIWDGANELPYHFSADYVLLIK